MKACKVNYKLFRREEFEKPFSQKRPILNWTELNLEDGIYSHTPSETILGEIPVLVIEKCLFSANIDAEYVTQVRGQSPKVGNGYFAGQNRCQQV